MEGKGRGERFDGVDSGIRRFREAGGWKEGSGVEIFVFVPVEVHIFLWRVRIGLWRFEQWVSKGVQKVIPVLSVQCMKSPGGHCPVRVNVLDHLLDVPYHTLIVGQDGSSDFTRVVTPFR